MTENFKQIGRREPEGIGNLGWKHIKLTAPIFVGDTIYGSQR